MASTKPRQRSSRSCWRQSSGRPAAGEEQPRIAERLARRGDEIMVCGQLYHTTAPVVLWTDPGGYDAYRLERRFVPLDQRVAAPVDKQGKPPGQSVRPAPQGTDRRRRPSGCGTGMGPPRASEGGRPVRHPLRRAGNQQAVLRGAPRHSRPERPFHARPRWHDLSDPGPQGAGLARHDRQRPIDRHRDRQHRGLSRRETPACSTGGTSAGQGGERRSCSPIPRDDPACAIADAALRPRERARSWGSIQGQSLRQYDFTDRQYDSLIRLTATLCTLFPRIRCDYPRDASGALIRGKLSDPELARYQGILGHYHVQTNKVDPGPAFQWDRVIEGARAVLAP